MNHKHFVILALFVFSSISFSFAKPATGQGLAHKDSSYYSDLYELVLESETNTTDLKDFDDTKHARIKVMQSFNNLCKDRDALDYVNWQSIDDKESDAKLSVVIFTCFEDYEGQKGTAFSFIIENEKKIITKLTQYEFSKDNSLKSDKKMLGIMIKESVALTASIGATFLVVSQMYPDQDDKLLHSTVSAVFAGAITSFSYHQLKLSKNKSAIVGAVTTCALGAAVEWVEPYVKYQGKIGDRDIKDMGADIVGCLIGSAFMRIAFQLE